MDLKQTWSGSEGKAVMKQAKETEWLNPGDLRLFLEEAAAAGLQTSGLQGLATLLEDAQEGDLDGQDYCALHELTVLK